MKWWIKLNVRGCLTTMLSRKSIGRIIIADSTSEPKYENGRSNGTLVWLLIRRFVRSELVTLRGLATAHRVISTQRF